MPMKKEANKELLIENESNDESLDKSINFSKWRVNYKLQAISDS